MSSVALIGTTTEPEFAPLVSWLQSQRSAVTVSEFPDIHTWEEHLTPPASNQLTLVMQTWSDQYSSEDVDRLIGATLYSGLVCCYGSWCEGDGRTREMWPHSTRVPVRYARQVVQGAILRTRSGAALLPPTAARDEVFLSRQSGTLTETSCSRGSAVVISPDRIYRTTLAQVLQEKGWDAATMPPEPDRVQAIRSPHLIIHDLDPDCELTAKSLQACRTFFPNTTICGLASQPARSADHTPNDFVVAPRLDPMLALAHIELSTDVTAA